MAKDEKPQDLMGYEALQQDAMRAVVRAALQRAASPRGLPGEHHFYISFRTGAPGVTGPDDLLGRYPEEMTIVLQNQYWDLNPGETGFSVTLQFGGQPKSLSIPYTAISRFYDPSVQYLLQFATSAPPEAPATAATADEPPAEDAPKIVSLDQFRKK
ncbi:MAG: ClpXP protease specificity-enhancing factor SspB [Caulobacteraceae bacterium]